MNHLARRIAAGAAVAALALTGCARPPAAAALVEGVRVSDEQVRATAEAYTTVLGVAPETALRQATLDLVLGEASTIIAARQNVPIADADVDAALGQYPAYGQVEDAGAGADWARKVGGTYVVAQRLGVEKLREEIAAMSIDVNPRYGRWDASRPTIVDGSLARLAADPDA